MIRTLIIDDEAKARQALRQQIAQDFADIEVVGEAANIAEGRSQILLHKPALVFLDVQMPDGTGFDLLASFDQLGFKVIFVSAFDHFAINAFRFSAVDYLLKPVHPNDLRRAIEKVCHQEKSQSDALKTLLNNNRSLTRIALPSTDELVFVAIQDIVRCESDSNYTHFYLVNGEHFLVSKTLKEYEDMLENQGFFRIHKSSLINLKHLKKYKKGEGGTVTMIDGSQLEVSRRRKDDFLKALNNL